jgi:hypothetical protein
MKTFILFVLSLAYISAFVGVSALLIEKDHWIVGVLIFFMGITSIKIRFE